MIDFPVWKSFFLRDRLEGGDCVSVATKISLQYFHQPGVMEREKKKKLLHENGKENNYNNKKER